MDLRLGMHHHHAQATLHAKCQAEARLDGGEKKLVGLMCGLPYSQSSDFGMGLGLQAWLAWWDMHVKWQGKASLGKHAMSGGMSEVCAPSQGLPGRQWV